MPDMKILHIIPGYEPAWGFGGTVTSIRNLCRALAEQGADVTVYTTNADGEGGRMNVSNEPKEKGGVTVRYFNCTLDPNRAFYSRGLSRELRQNVRKFDVVHSSTVWQWHQQSVHQSCSKSNTPHILSPHSCLMESAVEGVGNSRLKWLYWKAFVKRTVDNADAIHFLSEVERERSERYVNSDSSFVVPNGIDPAKYEYNADAEATIRSDLGLGESEFIILFLGRIAPKKRIERLIESLPSVTDIRDDVHLVVAGFVDDEEYYESLRKRSAQLGVDSNVIWHGPVPSNCLSDFYSIADLMALPSDVEGISMSSLEAMASGAPLLVSNEVGNYRAIDEANAGVVVDTETDSVRSALKSLVLDGDRIESMGENALELVQKQYTNTTVASMMYDAYEDVIDKYQQDGGGWSN